MRHFKDFEEIKEIYDKGKYDIFYENGDTKYEVRHIGCTIYCHNVEKNRGMGAVHNFDIKYFYGIERPEPEPEIDETLTEE